MAKRLIDANAIKYDEHTECMGHGDFETVRTVTDKEIAEIPTVDAVEVVRIEEVKNEILQTIDEFISEYRHISQSYVDHFGGKVDAMETARRLVNAALTDLCSYGERKNVLSDE